MKTCKECGQKVPEKSLEENLREMLGINQFYSKDREAKVASKIAKEHYLEAFDKATNHSNYHNIIGRIRQALEDA